MCLSVLVLPLNNCPCVWKSVAQTKNSTRTRTYHSIHTNRTQINIFIIWIVFMNYLSMTHNAVIDFCAVVRVLSVILFILSLLCSFYAVLSHYHNNKYLIAVIPYLVAIIDKCFQFFIVFRLLCEICWSTIRLESFR